MPFHYPFRVFANSNLGSQYDYTAFTGEWLPSKAIGQSPVLPEINLASGNIVLKSPCIHAQESVGYFELGYVYNAQNAAPWSLNIPTIISADKTKIIFNECDGSSVTYLWDESQNAYVSPSGAPAKLFFSKNADGGFLRVDPKTGERSVFDSSGKIKWRYDARGFKLKYEYSGDNIIITTDSGVYTITKNASVSTITFLDNETPHTQLLGTWHFDAASRLSSAVIPDLNYAVNYTYDGDTTHLTAVTQTDGTSVNLSYSADVLPKIKTIQLGSAGSKYTMDYADKQTTITDALGFVITANLNEQNNIEKWIQTAGDVSSDTKTLQTTCVYKNGDLSSISKANSAVKHITLNEYGLIVEEIDAQGQTTQYDYDDFDPGTFACIIKRELISGSDDAAVWAVTRYVYQDYVDASNNAFRLLRFVISPMGCVTEFQYNASNQLESERVYLQSAYDLTSLNPQTAVDYDAMVNWAFNQAKNKVALKSIVENNRGQKKQTQQFSEIDVNGDGVDSGASNNAFDYTAWGGVTTHTEKTDVALSAKTTHAFDALQRLTSTQKSLDQTQIITYNDVAQHYVVTEANGRAETYAWNDAGEITCVTATVLDTEIARVRSSVYDANGRVSSTTNIDGQITYQLFDSLNRLRFTVTPMGRVTEIKYDDKNRYQHTIHYYQPVSTTVAPTFQSLMPPQFNVDPDNDTTTFESFDLSGRVQFSVDGRGAITEYRYDLQNRKVATIFYSTQITTDEINALKSGAFSRTPDATKDIVERVAYDNDGHIIATQDGDGYVVSHDYNPAGFEVYRKWYATKKTLDLNSPIPIPDSSKDDFARYYYHDARGQVQFIVDDVLSANYIVARTYYPTGQLQSEIKYLNQSALSPSLDVDPQTLVPAVTTEDQETRYAYDLLKRHTKTYLPGMRLQEKQYDIMGNVIFDSIGDDPNQVAQVEAHITAKKFDDWGQLIAVVPPLLYVKIISILNDSTLSDDQKTAKVNAVWDNQSERYAYDAQTGLHTATVDIVPDDVDATNSANQAKTLFYFDADRRLVLTVGAEGEVSTVKPHPVFDKTLEKNRFANALDVATLPENSNGLMTDEIAALLRSIADPTNDTVAVSKYDLAGAQSSYVDEDGFETLTHTNMLGECDTKTLPVNSTTPTLQIARQFNLRRQCVQETKTADGKNRVTTKQYDNPHGKCTSETDANNATVVSTYEPRGVLSTSTDALGNQTAFSSDAFARRNKTVFPMGQSAVVVYDQTKRLTQTQHLDVSGSVLSAIETTSDAFDNVIIARDAEDNKTSIAYNAANQWENKTDALGNVQTRRHDFRGLVRSECFSGVAQYHTASVMHYGLSRELQTLIQDPDTLQLTTTHKTNALGQCYEKITPSNYVRQQKFNGRSQVTKHLAVIDDKTAVVTEKSYNGTRQSDSLMVSTTLQSNTATEVIGFDGFGRATTQVKDPTGLALTKTTVLDDVDRLIASIDAKGQTTYFIRDLNGNVRFEINARDGVTEHRYNAENKAIFTAQYITVVDASTLSQGMSIESISALITETQYDRHTYYFYDDLFNERFRVNRAGAVTETRFNKNAEKIAAIQYQTKLTADPATLTTASLITTCAQMRSTSTDKATFRVLDALGQEVFIFNPDGSVIQKFYYSTLQMVNAEIKYDALITNAETVSQLSIADIQAQLVPSSADRQSFWIRDSLNRLQFYVSPLGAVTRYEYDGNTANRNRIVEFTQTIMVPGDYASLVTLVSSLTPVEGVDNIEKRYYDPAEREITRVNALQKSESWQYDGAGRKSQHTTLSGNAWTYDYDGAGRLTDEYSPSTTVYTATVDSNNITAVTVASQVTTVHKKMAYDNNSNAMDITSAVGLDEQVISFVYNELDQKIKDQWVNLPVDEASKTTDLHVRPETTKTVFKTVLTGAHGAKLVAQDELGNPEFYAYDAQGELIYRVNALGYVIEYQRDVFCQAVKLIAYANPLTITLSDYVSTGIVVDAVADNLATVSDHSQDNCVSFLRDQCGRVTQMQRNPVSCYIPNADPTQSASIAAEVIPTEQTAYNAFGEVVSTSILIDGINHVWRQTMVWRDQAGNEIAQVDANGIAKIITLDAHGREIETYKYANVIPQSKLPLVNVSFSDLQNILTPLIDSSKDQHIKTERNALGQVMRVYHVGVVTQHIVEGQQAFADNSPADLGFTYTRTDSNKIKSITHPNGAVEIHYYDERDNLVAKAGVTRTQPDGTQIRPIEYYYLNAHGQCVGTFKPASGCAVDLDPASTVLPSPIATADNDRYVRFMRDARNNVMVHQDAENNLRQTTYSETGKLVRQFHQTTNGYPKADNKRETSVDETQKKYDALDRVIQSTLLTDGSVQDVVVYQRNAFAITAEGPSDGDWRIQRQFNSAGRKWIDNSDGTIRLFGHNAAGEETLRMRSLYQLLSEVENAGDLLAAMQTRDVLQIEFTESILDPGGRLIQSIAPGFPASSMQLPGKNVAADDSIVRPVNSLSWTAFHKKASITNPSGVTTTYQHDNFHNKLSVQIDPSTTVVDENGVSSVVSLKTTIARSETGAKIGRDRNGHVELFKVDEADHVVSHVAADGVPFYTKKYDVFDDDIEVETASQKKWLKQFNGRGKVIQVTQPSGDVYQYTLNENNFCIAYVPPAGSATGTTYYSQDIFGNTMAEYRPMGESDIYSFDRNHQVLLHEAINADDTLAYSVTRTRDYWGRETGRTDASGAVFEIIRFFDGSIAQEVQLSGDPGQVLPFNSTKGVFSNTPAAASQKNIAYAYVTSSRLKTKTDCVDPGAQTLSKIFNINGESIFEQEKNSAGDILRETTMTFDDLGRPLTQTDINFSLQYFYDEWSNRRRMNAVCGALTNDSWWTYDIADRVLINNGTFDEVNKIIQPSVSAGWGYVPPSGETLSYLNGLRATQSLYIPGSMGTLSDGNALSASFSYDCNDRVALISTTLPGDSLQMQLPISLPIAKYFPRDDQVPTLMPMNTHFSVMGDSQYRAALLVWQPLSGEIPGNTVVVAVGGNTCIPARSIASNPGSMGAIINFSDTSTSHIPLVITNINGTVYQDSVLMQSEQHPIYFPENVQYTPDGLLYASYIDLGNSKQFYLNQSLYNLNGNLTRCYSARMDEQTVVTYPESGFNVDGIPLSSTCVSSGMARFESGNSLITETRTNAIRYFDTSAIDKTEASITDSYGTNKIVSSRFYRNGILSAVNNIFNPFKPSDQNPYYVFLDYSLSGPVTRESVVEFDGLGEVVSNTTVDFFSDTNRNIVAQSGPVVSSDGKIKTVLQLIANPVIPFNISTSVAQASSYVIRPGDTWSSIAYALFRDASYAPILKASSGAQLIPGQTINFRQMLSNYNKSRDYTPLEQLMNAIYNALNPALQTPQPAPPPKPHHENFWDELIGGIVAIVLMVVLSHFLGTILATEIGSQIVADMAAGAIGGAVASAAQQGISILFGDQHSISLGQVLEYAATNAIMSGLTDAFHVPDILKSKNIEYSKYAEAFSANLTINTTVQLFQMAIGERKQFDFNLLIEQTIAATASQIIDSRLPAKTGENAKNGVDELENVAVGQLFGYPPNAADVLAQMTGNAAGNELNHAICPQSSTIVSSPNGNASNVGTIPNPSNFTNSALQTESHFVASSLSADDTTLTDPTASFYSALESTLPQTLASMDASTILALNAQSLQSTTQVKASVLQHSSDNSPSWLAREVYDHQNAWWARGILAVAGAMNSETAHMYLHALAPQNAMNLGGAIDETYTGFDPNTGRFVGREQGVLDSVTSATVLLVTGAEDVAAGVATSANNLVSKSWASLFGRSRIDVLSDMRSKVLGNIADSQVARSDTGFPVLEAKINQISSGYSADAWSMTTLNKGDIVFGGLPGQSAYYTDLETVLASRGDNALLGQALQIKPHSLYGYRHDIGSYEVLNEIRIPNGIVLNNQNLGAGGGRQFFLDNFSKNLRLLDQYNLQEFYEREALSTYRPGA